MNKNLLEIIKKATEETTGCDILKVTRRADHVQARNIFYKIARDNSYTLQAIGDFMNKDHASVMHGLKKFQFDSDTDKAFRGSYELVAGLVGQIIPIEEVKPSKALIEAYEAQNRILLSRVLELQLELGRKPVIEMPSDIETSLEGIPHHRIQSFKDNQLASFIRVEHAKIAQRKAQDAQDEIDLATAAAFRDEFNTKKRTYVMKSHTFDYDIA